MNYLFKLVRRIARHDPKEWLPLLWKNVACSLLWWRPSAVAARRSDRASDERWGTQISGVVNLSSLALDTDRARDGVRYQASSENTLLSAIEALNIDPRRYTFIDFGAGKGRIVMSASSLPFRRVLGVEFSAELCAAARENIEHFAAAGGSWRKAEIVHEDAGAFEPPAEPLICYFYNPFDAPIMREVIERLERFTKAGAADIRVIYVDARHIDLFIERGRWKLISNHAGTALLANAT